MLWAAATKLFASFTRQIIQLIEQNTLVLGVKGFANGQKSFKNEADLFDLEVEWLRLLSKKHRQWSKKLQN